TAETDWGNGCSYSTPSESMTVIARCVYVCFSQILRCALCTVRSRNSLLRTSARRVNSASSPVSGCTTSSGGKNFLVAALGAVTTGVPAAVISKIRRAHILGEPTTELTLRNTLKFL